MMYNLFTYTSSSESDRRIEGIVGRRAGASGYNFITGERDMHFLFFQKPAAERALKRLKQKRIKCSLLSDDEVRQEYSD